MKKLWLLLAFFMVAVTLCSPPRFGGVKVAAQSVAPPCGIAYWTPVPGEPLQSSTLGGELSHLESCAASAVPVGTPSPTATGCIAISGTWPYTIGCNAVVSTPSPVASAPITVGGTFPYNVGISNGACIGIVAGQEAYTCATPGPQATPSPTTTGCGIYSGSWQYTSDTTACAGLALNNTFTGTNIFSAGVTFNASPAPPQVIASPTGSPANCPGNAAFPTPGPQAAFCDGSPTNTVALAIGKQTGGWNFGGSSGTSTASGQLCFYRNSGAVNDVGWCMNVTAGGAGQLNVGGGASSILTSNTAFSTGTATITGGPLLGGGAACNGATPQTGAAGTYVCAITSSGGAWSYIFSRTFTSTPHPVCMVSDEGTLGGARVTAYAGSANLWTGCSGTSTGSDVVDVVVFGNSL